MTYEILTVRQVHDMCNHAERNIRAALTGDIYKEDIKDVIHNLALAKFYTWETAVQDPAMDPDKMELDWDQVYFFEETLKQMDDLELIQEICRLMPHYTSWLRTAPHLERRPVCEIWSRYSMSE